MDSDTYVLTCSRYIELNLVRAGMVADPGDYPWCSYQGNALGAHGPGIIPHPNYLALACHPTGLQTTCRALFCRHSTRDG